MLIRSPSGSRIREALVSGLSPDTVIDPNLLLGQSVAAENAPTMTLCSPAATYVISKALVVSSGLPPAEPFDLAQGTWWHTGTGKK